MSDTLDNVAGEQLLSFIERAERLHEEKKGIENDLKELYAEAKGNGFDTKAMKKILARRRKDYAELQEEEAIEELYLDAIERAERNRSSRARTQARDAREAETPKHDPETGEIKEQDTHSEASRTEIGRERDGPVEGGTDHLAARPNIPLESANGAAQPDDGEHKARRRVEAMPDIPDFLRRDGSSVEMRVGEVAI